jgi:hypothetical protein
MEETHVEPIVRARELALALLRVDLNEVSSVFQHLRDFLGQAGGNERAQRQAVDRWWQWLAAVAGPGAAAVRRSSQTGRYYGKIEEACRRNLRGLPPRELAETLGWAIRLARYYRGPGGILPPAPPEADEEIAVPASAPPKPKAPELPAVGEIVTWEIIQVDESAVVVAVPGFAIEKAIGVIKAEALGGRRYREGNAARAEVTGLRTLKSGRTIVELRPAKKEGA